MVKQKKRISNLEDKSFKIIEAEVQKEKRMKTSDALKGLMVYHQADQYMGVLEDEKRKGQRAYVRKQ